MVPTPLSGVEDTEVCASGSLGRDVDCRTGMSVSVESEDRNGAHPAGLLLVLGEAGVAAGLLGIDTVAFGAGDLLYRDLEGLGADLDQDEPGLESTGVSDRCKCARRRTIRWGT